MPFIPQANEGQVLNASSPVPIAASSEARLVGDTEARLGNAVFEVGNSLADIARTQAKHQAQLTAQLAAQNFQDKVLDEKAAAQAAAPIPDDPTGQKQVQAFRDTLQNHISTISDAMPDAESKALFQIHAMQESNSAAREIYASEVVKRAKNNDVMQMQIVSNSGDLVRKDITQLPDQLRSTEISLRSSPNIEPAQMEQRVAAAKQSVMMDGINGALERNQFDQARAALDTFSPGVLTPEEKRKQLTEIDSSEHSYYSNENSKFDRNEKLAKQQQEKQGRDALSRAAVLYQDAGPDENKRAAAEKTLLPYLASGAITPAAFSSITGSKVFTQAADSKYEGDVMVKLKDPSQIPDLKDQVYADRDAGKVSFAKSKEMIDRLDNYELRARTDPMTVLKSMQTQKQIQDLKNSGLVQGSPAEQADFAKKTDDAAMQFKTQMMDGSKTEPQAVAAPLVDAVLPPPKYNYKFQSNKEAEEQTRKLLKEHELDRAAGKITPELEKDYVDKLQGIDLAKRKLQFSSGGQ